MIEQEVDQHLTDESDINFVKMHLPCHFGKSIRQLGHLLNLTSEYYEHEMIDIKDTYRHSNKINATEQILRMKGRREFFRYKNMECEAQLSRLDDGTILNPLPPTRRLRGQKTDIKTLSQLAQWCNLPTGMLQNQIACYLKQFDILPAYAESDKAFSRLSDLKYTRYTAEVLPVANFQSEDVDQHIVICTGRDPSRKNQSPQNDIVLLWPDREIEGNFTSTRGRIPAQLCCLFLIQDSSCGIQACLALVQTLIPGPKKQPIVMVTVTKKEPQFPSTEPPRPDKLSVRRRPHRGVGASYVVAFPAVEHAAHLCSFSNNVGNRRWFLNSTIDLNAFNLLEE